MPAPVISVAPMREWEKATWASGQTKKRSCGKPDKPVAARRKDDQGIELLLVLSGKGHNGDDARFAANISGAGKLKPLDVLDPEATVTNWSPYWRVSRL